MSYLYNIYFQNSSYIFSFFPIVDFCKSSFFVHFTHVECPTPTPISFSHAHSVHQEDSAVYTAALLPTALRPALGSQAKEFVSANMATEAMSLVILRASTRIWRMSTYRPHIRGHSLLEGISFLILNSSNYSTESGRDLTGFLKGWLWTLEWEPGF